LYVAFDPDRAEESGEAHKKVKRLFQQRNDNVVSAMSEFADIARRGREAILKRDYAALSSLVNANFDLRNSIFTLSEENKRMVFAARESGASAKFAGSGGAIVGLYEDEAQYERLCASLAKIGCRTFRPTIAQSGDEKIDLPASGWRNS
jgi:glucuronokinase